MAIKSQGLIKSSIRTSRVCGPNGHAAGKKWNVVRGMAISPYHENCVPHNYPSANIVLPLQCPKTNLIVGAMPLYMGVEKKGAAASAPKRGIPQYGFHVKPDRAPMLPLGGLEMEPAGQMMNQELTLTRFNGARILKLLACKNPSSTGRPMGRIYRRAAAPGMA